MRYFFTKIGRISIVNKNIYIIRDRCLGFLVKCNNVGRRSYILDNCIKNIFFPLLGASEISIDPYFVAKPNLKVE